MTENVVCFSLESIWLKNSATRRRAYGYCDDDYFFLKIMDEREEGICQEP